MFNIISMLNFALQIKFSVFAPIHFFLIRASKSLGQRLNVFVVVVLFCLAI